MWKYVGHRIKDSVELCTHLKNLRSTFSTTQAKPAPKGGCFDKLKKCRVYNAWESPDAGNSHGLQGKQKEGPYVIDNTFFIEKYCPKQKQKHQAFHKSCDLSFWQWTAGILCSIYFGKWMCIYARHRQNRKRWYHMEQLLTERALQQTLRKFNKSQYQRSYVPSNDVHHWYEIDRIRGIRGMQALLPLVPVTNDHLNPKILETGSPVTLAAEDATTQTAPKRTDVSFAAEYLISTLGDIEFRLAKQNFRANEHETGVSHLKLATTHGHPEATYNLGICYETGTGIEKNMKYAMQCYRTAAGLGHKGAMYNLGVFYVHGLGGLVKNRHAARACFEAAGKIGLTRAQKMLSLPEEPVKKDEEVSWKSYDLIERKFEGPDVSAARAII